MSASKLERRDPFPACSEKNSRRSRRISRAGALHRKGERNSRVVPSFPESPRCLSPLQGKLFSLHSVDFQDEDRLTPRWQVGQPCGKALWESLVGKPRGKATDPLIHAKGSATLLLQLGRKAHLHAPTREEVCLPWGDSRSTPRSMFSTGEESSGSGTDSTQGLRPRHRRRGNPRGPRAARMGTGLS